MRSARWTSFRFHSRGLHAPWRTSRMGARRGSAQERGLMPVSYTVTERGSFVDFVATGSVTGEEIIAQAEAIAVDERIAPGYAKLCDTTGITALEVKADFFDALLEIEQRSQLVHRLGRMAIVVS